MDSLAAYREGARQLYLQFRDGKIYRYFERPVSVCGVPDGRVEGLLGETRAAQKRAAAHAAGVQD